VQRAREPRVEGGRAATMGARGRCHGSGAGTVTPDEVLGQSSPSKPGTTLKQQFDDLNHRIREVFKLERVVRVHVVLADISHMAEMDAVYREFFPTDPPARTAWSMQLRFGNGCEIECVALAG